MIAVGTLFDEAVVIWIMDPLGKLFVLFFPHIKNINLFIFDSFRLLCRQITYHLQCIIKKSNFLRFLLKTCLTCITLSKYLRITPYHIFWYFHEIKKI